MVIIAKRNRGEVVKNAGATAGCVISNRNWWTIFGRSAIIAAKKGVMYMKIAEQIVSQRMRLGMTQEELADRLEISRQSVSKWETGASIPDVEKLVKLAQLFGVTLDELVTGKRPAPAEAQTTMTPAKFLGVALEILAVLCVVVTIFLGPTLGIHTGGGLMLSAWFAILGAMAWDPGNEGLRRSLSAVCMVAAVLLVVLSIFGIFWFDGVVVFSWVCITLVVWAVMAKKRRT